jgi:hypothetical protein
MRKFWKVKQGNTALVEGCAELILRNLSDSKNYYLERLANGYCVLGYKNESILELYSFHQYDSEVLPEQHREPFATLMPSNAPLVRPIKKPKERIFDSNPLR